METSLGEPQFRLSQAESACSLAHDAVVQWGAVHTKAEIAVGVGLGLVAVALAAKAGVLAKTISIASEASKPATDMLVDASVAGERAAGIAMESAPIKGSAARLEAEMAAKAAQRVKTWYPLMEPRLGVHLTDPNVVLTLAEARGQTEFFVPNALASDADAFARLNDVTKSQGVLFSASPVTLPAGEPALFVKMRSLGGYQRVAAETKLPGIPNKIIGGWHGLDSWFHETTVGIPAAVKQGLYPKKIDLSDILLGVVKGYPDNAVLAFATKSTEQLVDTDVPFSRYYPGAQPNYCYDPKDAAGIARHVEKWGSILEGYYTSPEHRALAADMKFMQYRLPSRLSAAKSLADSTSGEVARLPLSGALTMSPA